MHNVLEDCGRRCNRVMKAKREQVMHHDMETERKGKRKKTQGESRWRDEEEIRGHYRK